MRKLFDIGAVGEIIQKIQVALTGANFDTKGIDGWYGDNTAAAVSRFQSAKGLPIAGAIDDDTWQALMESPIPTVSERSLQLTASFEGHGFGLAVGNFDGAMLTWGIIGFTMASGEVQKIILAINESAPDLVQQAFQADADTVISIMKAPNDEQKSWANSLTGSNGMLVQPWRSMFQAFGSFPQVQEEQLRHVQADYMDPAINTAKKLGFISELGLALCFDIHVQNGGIKAAAMTQIKQSMLPEMPELDLRKIVANAVADFAQQRWSEDVRRRKLVIAIGQGNVHGHSYVMQNMGLDSQFSAPELAGTG
jgi:hypothetical protein